MDSGYGFSFSAYATRLMSLPPAILVTSVFVSHCVVFVSLTQSVSHSMIDVFPFPVLSRFLFHVAAGDRCFYM